MKIRKFCHVFQPTIIIGYDTEGNVYKCGEMISKYEDLDFLSPDWRNLNSLLNLKDKTFGLIIEILEKNPKYEFVLTAEDFYL